MRPRPRSLTASSPASASSSARRKRASFRAHRLLLRDPALVGKVKTAILHRLVDARTALHELIDEYTLVFEKIDDEYLKERMSDIRDVVTRIIAHLAQDETPQKLIGDEPVILVAPEIMPSQALLLEKFTSPALSPRRGAAPGTPPFSPARSAFRRCRGCAAS